MSQRRTSEPSDEDPQPPLAVTRWDARDVDELHRHDMLLRLDAIAYSALLHDGGSDEEIEAVRRCLRTHLAAMRQRAAATSTTTVPLEWAS
jgi:hypothetical protein